MRSSCTVLLRTKFLVGISLAWLGALLSGCTAEAPTAPPAPPPTEAPLVQPTRVWPTPEPTATMPVFELRPTFTPQPTPTATTISSLPGFGYGPDNFPPNINPLTGLQVSDISLLDYRPAAIKITNFPREARPQWGLNLADHVYEYYTEDQMTRFIAIFHGQYASQVGPIRSARPIDAHIARAYRAILAFGYGDDRVMEILLESNLRNRLVIERPDNCPPLCRVGPKNAYYNNLFTDTQQLHQYVTDRGTDDTRQDLNGLRFEDNSLVLYGGSAVQRIAIRYTNISYNLWEYEPTTRRYLRSQETDTRPPRDEVYQPLIDSLTGQQVFADNLIILLVNTTYFFQSHSTEIFDINLVGQGEAYAMRDGRVFKITWKRPASESFLTLEMPNGEPFPLKPGNVWFQVLGESSTHTINDLDWSFTYSMP